MATRVMKIFGRRQDGASGQPPLLLLLLGARMRKRRRRRRRLLLDSLMEMCSWLMCQLIAGVMSFLKQWMIWISESSAPGLC